MNNLNRRMMFALLLIAAGVLFLLQNLGVLGSLTGLVWAVLFALGGLAFLSVLVTNRTQWWAAIPGIVLLDVGVLIAFTTLFPNLDGRLSGGLFLLGLGLAFWVVFALAPQNWWAVIPGGVMVTLAAVTAMESFTGDVTGAVFMLGLALTFLLLYFIPVRGRRMTWPWIPALVLGAIGFLVLFQASNMINIAWPVILILAGGFLLVRAYLRHSSI